MATVKVDALRDESGKYAVGFERLCRCGHPKGHHTAGPKGRSAGECITHEVDGGQLVMPQTCPCERFSPARQAAKSSAAT